MSKTASKFEQNTLPARVETVADWMQIKRHEKRLERYHIAFKMGTATPSSKPGRAESCGRTPSIDAL
jgi:hypothetical protein